jgi:NitT/TauT family transport system substrate-binding protein
MVVERRLHALAAALLACACARAQPERITLGIAHLPAFGLVFIAEEQGYFARHGVVLEQRRFATGRDALAALARGEVEAATSYSTPVVLRASRERLEVLTTLHASQRGNRLVARADRRIALAEDLAGKRIGVTLGTGGEFFLHTLLAYAGVEGAAKLVDLGPTAAVDALVAGDVDAIVTWPPHAHRARRLVAGGTVELTSEAYAELSVIAVRAGTSAARRGALVKLLAALADAERLVQDQPEEAFRALRAEFPGEPEEALREIWSGMVPALGVTHELAAVLEREAAWFRARGRTDGPALDVGALLAPGVLAEAAPEAVTFVAPPGAWR